MLEQVREIHETIEQCELAIGVLLDEPMLTQKDRVHQQHRVAHILNTLTSKYGELVEVYNIHPDNNNNKMTDAHAILLEDIAAIRDCDKDDNGEHNPDKMFESFYAAVASAQSNNNNFYDENDFTATATAGNGSVDSLLSSLELLSIEPAFSGEEVFGKYLDLHQHHQRYLNLPFVAKAATTTTSGATTTTTATVPSVDYLQYLDMFYHFFQCTNEQRQQQQYQQYLQQLFAYLVDFIERVQPLVDVKELVQGFEQEFLHTNLPNNNNGDNSNNNSNEKSGLLRLGMFNDVSELEALGLERLQQGLVALGLKAGGSLRERAERLWSVRGKKSEDFPKKLLARSNNDQAATTTTTTTTGTTKPKLSWLQQVLCTEHKITKLCIATINDIVHNTKQHQRKQQTRTLAEKQQQLFEEEFGIPLSNNSNNNKNKDENGDGEDGDDDDDLLYNPKNIPLGWDGKPIPYWLYKLHELNVVFECEICGNQKYYGRYNFNKHFQEHKHVHGLKCLGIPNTKHFHDITLVADALSLYQRLLLMMKQDEFSKDSKEEFEDSEGNVLNKQTYEDLARQGLL